MTEQNNFKFIVKIIYLVLQDFPSLVTLLSRHELFKNFLFNIKKVPLYEPLLQIYYKYSIALYRESSIMTSLIFEIMDLIK